MGLPAVEHPLITYKSVNRLNPLIVEVIRRKEKHPFICGIVIWISDLKEFDPSIVAAS